MALCRGKATLCVLVLVALADDWRMRPQGTYIKRKGLEFILICIEFSIIYALCLQWLKIQSIATLESGSIVGRTMSIFLNLRRYYGNRIDVEEISLIR